MHVFRFSPSNPDLLRSCDGIVQVNPPAFIIAVNCRPATADFVKDTLFSVLKVLNLFKICLNDIGRALTGKAIKHKELLI